jgi:hypothetical protein
MLQPVSFKKGRKSLPRLSQPYVPGRHSKRFWTEEENQILRQHYPSKGFAFCASKLEDRSRLSIYQQAQKLGLKYEKSPAQRRRHDYAALDAEIQRLWPDFEKPRGAVSGVKALAKQLGKPHWMITQRLRKLGLTVAAIKEPNWTAAEDALLEHVPRHDVDKASEIFRAHGFHRTPTAIMVRCKRIGLSRRYKDTFSARTAAAILGMDNKTISQLCIDGIIKAERRASRRLPQQGGSPHSITPKALRQFVIDHLERIDFRRVDKFELVKLLTMA